MKKNSLMSVALLTFLTACSQDSTPTQQAAAMDSTLASIQISNPSSFKRRDQAIVIPANILAIPADTSVKANGAKGVQWIDQDSNGRNESLLVLLDLDAGESASLTLVDGVSEPLSARAHAEISIKQGGAWNGDHYDGGVFQQVKQWTTPEQYTDHSEYVRYEGPGIESELVGYRIYIDWRNGLDVFGKTTPALVLKDVGLDGYQSYHDMSDWGMDIQKVGKSAGVGGYGIWHEGSLQRVSDVKQRHVKVVNDGPLYASFQIHYDDWSLKDQQLGDLFTTFSMQAGSRLLQIDLQSDTQKELAAALPKHKNAHLFKGNIDITRRAWSYVYTLGEQSMHEEPQANFVIFQRNSFKDYVEDEFQYAVLLNAAAGQVTYYTGSLWSMEKDADVSQDSVEAFLKQQVEILTKAPRVIVENGNSSALKNSPLRNAVALSQQVANSEIARHGTEIAYGNFDTMRNRQSNWEYTTGLLTQSIYQQGKLNESKPLVDWATSIIDSYVESSGAIRTYHQENYNIDSINSGKMLLQLLKDTGQEKYRLAADHLRMQLKQHPKLEAGAYWHKKRYPYQLWLDGVYMGMPFLAEYSVMFENGAGIADVMHEFEVVRTHLRDAKTGLYWHAWDEKAQQEWALPESGLSKHFWSRGMGWLAMAIVDTWNILPATYEKERAYLADMATELAVALLAQQVDGVWYQITDQPMAVGNYAESSATAMFSYFFAKGVAIGMLPESFKSNALSTYQALVQRFVLIDADQQYHLMSACEVGGLGFGRDGSYDYYMSEPVIANDPKVLGPFIMTGQFINQLQD